MIPVIVFIIASIVFIILRLNSVKGTPKFIQQKYTPEIDIPTTLTVHEFVLKYNSYKGNIKGGAVCFWGYWFGKPYDNFHQIAFVGYDEVEHKLELLFTESESLIVEFPENIKEYNNHVIIESAKKIIWKWHPYGRPYTNTPEDYSYIEIIKNGDALAGTADDEWRGDAFKKLDINKPAILITS